MNNTTSSDSFLVTRFYKIIGSYPVDGINKALEHLSIFRFLSAAVAQHTQLHQTDNHNRQLASIIFHNLPAFPSRLKLVSWKQHCYVKLVSETLAVDKCLRSICGNIIDQA